MSRSFLPACLGGGSPVPTVSGPGHSLAAALAKAEAAEKQITALQASLTEKESALTALTEERDTIAASLSEKETALAHAETALAAEQKEKADMLAEQPEKIKLAAIDLVASGGIPAGGTPPETKGGPTDLASALANCTTSRQVGAARLAALAAATAS